MSPPSDIPGEAATGRRARLVGVKLRALVSDHLGRGVDVEPSAFPPGAALMIRRSAWAYVDSDPERRLGSALAWAIRHGADELHVIAEAGTGVLARRAAEFAFPISVWHADGRLLLPAVAEPVAAPTPADPRHLHLTELIAVGGAVPTIEHGVVFGEVRGLEVCRVVEDRLLGGVRLEVGVGVHDREAFRLIHGDVPPVEALAGVVDAVLRHRGADVPQHPLNRLARERLLRWRLEQDPGRVGAASLTPVQPPIPRRAINEVVACSAAGPGVGSGSVLVVCSAGVDLDVVAYAADARLAAASGGWGDGLPGVGGGELHVVVALPARDVVAVTADLAGLLAQPVALVPVD